MATYPTSKLSSRMRYYTELQEVSVKHSITGIQGRVITQNITLKITGSSNKLAISLLPFANLYLCLNWLKLPVWKSLQNTDISGINHNYRLFLISVPSVFYEDHAFKFTNGCQFCYHQDQEICNGIWPRLWTKSLSTMAITLTTERRSRITFRR